jgi:hypothetical protein
MTRPHSIYQIRDSIFNDFYHLAFSLKKLTSQPFIYPEKTREELGVAPQSSLYQAKVLLPTPKKESKVGTSFKSKLLHRGVSNYFSKLFNSVSSFLGESYCVLFYRHKGFRYFLN